MRDYSFFTKTLSVIVLAILLFFILIMTKGNEDNWICVAGKWVKHGNPTVSIPTASECK